MNPDWQWWQDKLAGKDVPMSEGTPHAGFYRWPQRIGGYGGKRRFIPVAYWPGENGELHCRVGDDDLTPVGGRDIWVNVGNNPVSEEAYRAVAERGEPWPDEHEAVPMGHNKPPDIDWDRIESIAPGDTEMFKLLQDRIDDLGREAEKRIEGPPIADQDEADRIANLADALAQFHRVADNSRAREKKPHDDAAKAIQQRWLPLLFKAETYKNLKYKLLTPWLNSLEDKAKKEAEAAAAAGTPAAADARRPRAGTRGRAMTLKQTKKAKITDYAACLAFFADSEDVRGTVQMLANRAVRAGMTVPGAEVEEMSQAV